MPNSRQLCGHPQRFEHKHPIIIECHNLVTVRVVPSSAVATRSSQLPGLWVLEPQGIRARDQTPTADRYESGSNNLSPTLTYDPLILPDAGNGPKWSSNSVSIVRHTLSWYRRAVVCFHDQCTCRSWPFQNRARIAFLSAFPYGVFGISATNSTCFGRL